MKTYLKDCRHGKFLLINGDMISNHVNMYGEWSEAEVELFRDILTPTANVVEVGSNIGMHTIPLSALCSKGKVFAYEPQRPIFHVLCANIALNNRLNIVAKHLAVADAAGQVDIPTSTYDEAWNYGSFSIAQGFNTEGYYQSSTTPTTINVIPLDDDPCLQQLATIDLLKVDAEGLEPQILKGCRKLFNRHKPRLFIEVNTQPVLVQVLDLLKVADYSAYWFFNRRFRATNFNRNMLRVHGYDRNIICTHRSRPIRSRHNLRPVEGWNDIQKGVVPILD